MESLEMRTMRSVDVYKSGDTLYVDGDWNANVVVVEGDQANGVDVKLDGNYMGYSFYQVNLIVMSGGDGHDELTNDTDIPSIIYGDLGDDTLTGSDGASDTIYGGFGSDELYGRRGDDYLNGSMPGFGDDNADDWLLGEGGDDTATTYWGDTALTCEHFE